jgi:hypothetical protein
MPCDDDTLRKAVKDVSHERWQANCAKSFVTREGVERSAKGYVAPEVGLPWPEWIKV